MSSLAFRVVPTHEVYMGKTYSSWIADWCNWFFIINPDQYNTEPWNKIKFLRSFPSPDKIASFAPGERIRYEGHPMYRNIPNVLTGKNRIVMYDDQAIFFPVMLALWINSDNKDYGYMERWVKTQNSNSDDPPLSHQITVDGLPLLPSSEISNHKIDSNGPFPLNIPDAEYGTSLKDFVTDPSPPGWYETYCQGYFFLIDNFRAREEYYTISSRVRGAPYDVGEYFATFVYEIQVIPSYLRPTPPKSGMFPERIFDGIIKEIGPEKTDDKMNIPGSQNLIEMIEFSQKADRCYLENKENKSEAESNAIMMLILGRLKNIIFSDSTIMEEDEKEILTRILNKLEFKIITAYNGNNGNQKHTDTVKINSTEKEKVDHIMRKTLGSRMYEGDNEEIRKNIHNVVNIYNELLK